MPVTRRELARGAGRAGERQVQNRAAWVAIAMSAAMPAS